MSLSPEQRVEAVRKANNVQAFPRLVPITRLDGSVGPIDPTLFQRILMWYFERHAWTYTVKYRQGMSSVIHIADQLRYISYTPGAMGMVIGDKEDTYKELMRRIGIMYDGLHPAVQTPLARPPSSEIITFDKPHNGLIQGLTGGGENPAIGFSPDYGVISEYGLFEHYTNFDGNFFPAMERRPNARCRIETTPGTYNSPAHEMFKSALRGDGLFQAVFGAWWHDPTCVSNKPMPSNFQRTSEELHYAEKLLAVERAAAGKTWWKYAAHCPIDDAHLWLRRSGLETHFHGDPRLFDNKYPPSPHEGWIVGSSPTIPVEPIARLRLTARPAPEDVETYYEAREPGCPYLLTVDGTGYGKQSGDPAAFILWNMWDWREAGSWSGREDPGVLSKRVLRVQKAWDCDVIVETNKDGLAAALDVQECPKLHWSNGQPGWFSNSVSKKAALIALVDLLRSAGVLVLSEPTIEQLATWDGKLRSEHAKHHFDRAICCLLFSYAAEVLGHQRRPQPKVVEVYRGMTAATFDALFAKPDRGHILGGNK